MGEWLEGFSCRVLINAVDMIVDAMADESIAVEDFGLDSAVPKEDTCSAFQKFGAYCGCEEADPPCRLCPAGEGTLLNPETYVPGTLIEKIFNGVFQPTCGQFDTLYRPNSGEGSEECESHRELVEGVCECSGPGD
uniref:Uncharacterized protein n=1 Tax=Odontella aurita TaxID=265563 RepID=A0A7S4IE01_9STRA|mmetsp:Transcript_23719/g.70157  ORF Transcript_23719/g.70157 Transcript_23719/m.70157 type:complete len:136 (+) Transcript_23719:220-627(+)